VGKLSDGPGRPVTDESVREYYGGLERAEPKYHAPKPLDYEPVKPNACEG